MGLTMADAEMSSIVVTAKPRDSGVSAALSCARAFASVLRHRVFPRAL
jgi:hypothetical protein